jgi:hypothetical protein
LVVDITAEIGLNCIDWNIDYCLDSRGRDSLLHVMSATNGNNGALAPQQPRVTPQAEPELIRLCRTRQWNSAITQVNHNPSEAFMTHNPHGTAIATACRYSAPAPVIQALVDGMSRFRRQQQQQQQVEEVVTGEVTGLIGPTLNAHAAANASLAQINPLRLNSGGRGTPLHEAVDNEEIDLDVIKILIEADGSNLGLVQQDRDSDQELPSVAEDVVDPHEDESVSAGTSTHSVSPRRSNNVPQNQNNQEVQAPVGEIVPPEAICTQDVDGQIPLHLMIRRVFRSCPRPLQGVNVMEPTPQSQAQESQTCNHADSQTGTGTGQAHVEATQYDTHLLQVLADVIDAYPEGCNVSDMREYQETPLVLSLKANLYAQYRASPYSIRPDALTVTLTLSEESTKLWDAMLETRICRVIQIMLQRYPLAANHLSAVASNRYTMLHSALFHGRICKTLDVIMGAARLIDSSAETQMQETAAESARNRRDSPSSSPSVSLTERRVMTLPHLLLQPNTTNAEVPLHVACMRLEKLATLELLCRQGPKAVSKRDQHGRTPLMWLWIRYGAVAISAYGGEPGGSSLSMAGAPPLKSSAACSCAATERPVTFFEMRYVPADHVRLEDQRTSNLIKLLRPRLRRLTPSAGTSSQPPTGLESWLEAFARNPLYNFEFPVSSAATRSSGCSSLSSIFQEEDELTPGKRRMYHKTMFASSEAAGAVLLWEKVLVMLRACLNADTFASTSRPTGSSSKTRPTSCTTLLHVAATFPCVPSFVVDVALELYPQFVSTRDESGRLPLHCAAARPLYEWKPFPRIGLGSTIGTDRSSSSLPLEEIVTETPFLHILQAYPDAVRVFDFQGRLPLHHAIDSAAKMVHGCFPEVNEHEYRQSLLPNEMHLYQTMLQPLIDQWPASLEYPDNGTGVTTSTSITSRLLPFMQAAALPEGAASSHDSMRCAMTQQRVDRVHLNMVYSLLRLNPEMARGGAAAGPATAMPTRIASTNKNNSSSLKRKHCISV